MMRLSSATADIDKPLRAQSKAPDVYSKKRECVCDCKCNAICFGRTCLWIRFAMKSVSAFLLDPQNEVTIEFGGLLSCQIARFQSRWKRGGAFHLGESKRLTVENSTFYTRRWAKKGARCLHGVRGSRPLYTMIAWCVWVRKCNAICFDQTCHKSLLCNQRSGCLPPVSKSCICCSETQKTCLTSCHWVVRAQWRLAWEEASVFQLWLSTRQKKGFVEKQHDFTCSKPWLQRIVKIWTTKHVTFLSNLGLASWEASDISFQRGVFNIESTPAVWILIGKSPLQSPRKPFYPAQYSFYSMNSDWWFSCLLKHEWQKSIFLYHLNYQSIWRLNGRQANANAVVSKQQSLPDNSKNEWYDKAPHAQMPQ